MDEHFRDLHLLRDLEQTNQMNDVGVNTTVRNQTEQVQTAVALLSTSEGLGDVVHLLQLILLEGLVDTNAVLPDHTARTNVQMAHFTVTHETLWQSDG